MSVLIIKESGYKISTNVDDLTTAILAYGYIGASNIHEKYNKYRLLSNDVDFFWGFTTPPAAMLIISFKGNELLKYDNPSNQLVIDYLNKFDGLTKNEIEKLVVEAQEVSKTQLELEIIALQEEKDKLQEKIAILMRLDEKREEVKSLINDLIK
jgi:hypothetical protein